MVRIRFTNTNREYTTKNPENIPAIIRKEAEKQGWPDTFGMKIIGTSAAEYLRDFEIGFPCQINIFYFNNVPYEGFSVGDTSAVSLNKIKTKEEHSYALPTCLYKYSPL